MQCILCGINMPARLPLRCVRWAAAGAQRRQGPGRLVSSHFPVFAEYPRDSYMDSPRAPPPAGPPAGPSSYPLPSLAGELPQRPWRRRSCINGEIDEVELAAGDAEATGPASSRVFLKSIPSPLPSAAGEVAAVSAKVLFVNASDRAVRWAGLCGGRGGRGGHASGSRGPQGSPPLLAGLAQVPMDRLQRL